MIVKTRVRFNLFVIVTFDLTLITECATLGISERLFKKATPPIIKEDRDAVTLGNYQMPSAFECAVKCSSTSGCGSFLFKTSDKPQQNCFNDSTPQDFTGNVAVTYDGTPCDKNWDVPNPWSDDYGDSSFPEGSTTDARSYCRDPRPDGYLWCQKNQDIVWDTCNIPRCMTSNCRLFSRSFNSSLRYPIEDTEFYYDPTATP